MRLFEGITLKPPPPEILVVFLQVGEGFAVLAYV
jgi:hypothetical protein